MAGLLSRLKTNRKSVEHLEKEDFLRKKAVHHYKVDLWNAVLTAAKKVSDEIKCLTSSMDERIFSLANKNGKYIHY